MCVNCWAKTVFIGTTIWTLFDIGISLYKTFEDILSPIQYYNDGDIYFFVISLSALIGPSLFYAIYLSIERFSRDEDFLYKIQIPILGRILNPILNGLLIIPWEIWSHLKIFCFSVAKFCSCFSKCSTSDEEESINKLQKRAQFLNFFQSFYSGFSQLILQIIFIFLL